MSPTAPRRVLHCITTLEPAGAQTLLLDLIARIDPARYACSIAYLIGDRGIAASGAPCPILDLSREGRFDPLCLPRLAGRLRAERIELVHTHLVHGGVVGKLAAKLAGVRATVTTRHYARESKSRSFVYRLEDRLTGGADRVIAVSAAVREFLTSEGIVETEKVRLLPNAIDFARFDPARFAPARAAGAPSHASSPPVIGTIGRLHPQKGHDVLVRAFAELRRHCPEAKLEIVGEGAMRGPLRALIEQLGQCDAVCLAGNLPPERIPERLAGWSLFVLPSRWEAFGLALLEAMAMELPVVATAVEGTLELIEPDVTGLLTPLEDAGALASAMAYLLAHPERARAMGREARARSAERYDLARAAMGLSAIYDELLGPR